MRATTPGWRDPRLWIGIVIVAASVLAGAQLLDSADDTVSVWAVTSDMGAGDQLSEDDLVARQVRFADGGDLDHYFRVDDQLPADLQLIRGIGEGELLPRAAAGSAEDSDTLQVSIEVEPGQVPSSVAAGSVVDIYLIGVDGAERLRGRAAESATSAALSSVAVVDAPPIEESFGTSGRRQIVLAVPEADVAPFYALLGALDDPVLSVVRRS